MSYPPGTVMYVEHKLCMITGVVSADASRLPGHRMEVTVNHYEGVEIHELSEEIAKTLSASVPYWVRTVGNTTVHHDGIPYSFTLVAVEG